MVCFTPNHGKSFFELTESQVRTLLDAWIDRTEELSKIEYIQHIAPFENRGEEIGVTLHHPHGQIYAYSYIPPRIEKMLSAAEKFQKENKKNLFDSIVSKELNEELRIVAHNKNWIAYVPYAARYPYEIHLTTIKPVADLTELDQEQRDSYPSIALEIMRRLEGVFNIQMAYIATWYQAPVRQGRDMIRLHWTITSVRRAPGKLKYLAGSESAMGAFIMDVSPEVIAQQLREVKL